LKLENDTLRLLNESKGPILENEMLISTLQSAKETTVTVKEALATAEVTEREINFVREGYRSGAKRAAILYFVIQDLANIDPMYQFSLAAYNDIFKLSIEKSTKNPVLDQRIENLNEYHTFSLYK
jgi:dynein heavy chain, axonemal